MEFTLSVRSFHVPATPRTSAWPPSLPSVPTSRATRVTSDAKALSWSTMVLIVFFSSRISPCTSTVILRDRSPLARSEEHTSELQSRVDLVCRRLLEKKNQLPACHLKECRHYFARSM